MPYHDLLTENARVIDEFLAAQFLSPTASPSSSASWRRATLPAPTNVVSFTHEFDSSASRRSTRTSCHAVLASLDEALQTLNTDVTSTLRRVESELLGADLLLDAQVLEALRPRTKETPHEYVGLKHVKYRSLADEFHAEEFLLLETMGKGVHPATGLPYGFKFAASVDLPEWEFEIESANSHHAGIEVHRGVVHSLLVLLSETTHRGILKMQVWLDVDLTPCDEPFYGGFSSLHDAFSLAIRYRHVIENASTSGFAGSAALQFLPTGSTTAFRERKCQTCEKKLGLFSRKKHHLCAVCGLFVCTNCLTPTDFNAWKLCVHCFERNERLVMRTRVSRLASIGASLGGLVTRITRSYSRQRESMQFAPVSVAAAGGGERGSLVGALHHDGTKPHRHKSSLLRLTALHKANGSNRSAYETILESDNEFRNSLFDGTSASFLANAGSSNNGGSSTEPRSRSAGDTDAGPSLAASVATTRSSLQMPPRSSDFRKHPAHQGEESAGVPPNSALRISELSGKTVISNASMGASGRFGSWKPAGSVAKLKLLDDDAHSRLSGTTTTWGSTSSGEFREDFHSIPETDSRHGVGA
jgi:hypothetical protein